MNAIVRCFDAPDGSVFCDINKTKTITNFNYEKNSTNFIICFNSNYDAYWSYSTRDSFRLCSC